MLKNLTVNFGMIALVGGLGTFAVQPAEAAKEKSCVCHTDPSSGESNWVLVTHENSFSGLCGFGGFVSPCGSANRYCDGGDYLGKGSAQKHKAGHGEYYFNANTGLCKRQIAGLNCQHR